MTTELNCDRVGDLIYGFEPSRGGYHSEFELEETDEGVKIQLIAEWLPRYLVPEVTVTKIDGDLLTIDYGGGLTKPAEEIAELLADIR